MEFFSLANVKITPDKIQTALSISDLPKFCASIYEVMHDYGEQGEINCLWGVFFIRRELINGGVRFTLPDCPNTVAWTVTTGLPPDPDVIDVHCAIRRKEPDPDFQDSVDEFMEDWRKGLENELVKVTNC